MGITSASFKAMLLVVALTAGTAMSRQLHQSDANCAAYAFLQIKVIGGSCWGASGASCDAVASSTSAYQQAFNDWYGGDFYNNCCVDGRADAAATAIAEAVAKVYTDAYTNVQCDVSTKGKGIACGWSQANGDAWATASARAIASASADAGGPALCISDVEAISQVVVDVAAKALSDGCAIDNSSVFNYGQSYKEALQRGIAQAFASAAAWSCNADGTASASANCEGHGISKSSGSQSDDGGSGYISRGDVAPCTGDVVTKCCASSYRFASCRCNDCDGNMSRTSDYDDKNNLRTWVGEYSGGKCVCA